MQPFIIALFAFYITTASGQPVNISDASNAKSVNPLVTSGQLIATLEADRQTAYVNEQILLTLRVSAPSFAFNITGKKLAVPGVELLPVNKQESTFDRNGVSHQSVQTVFALFAKEPGTVQIPSLSFKAILPTSAGMNNAGKGNPTLTAATQVLQLTIDSAPVVETGWLPAQNLQVSSNWSHDKNTDEPIRAGEPVSRNITIKVSGQYPGAIAQLNTVAPEGIRTYPDRPQMETDVTVTGINGIHTQSTAIVASNAGSFTLPAIDIEWWNIDKREWQTTTLPSEQFLVTEAIIADASSGQIKKIHYQYALAGLLAVVILLSGGCVALWRRNKQLVSTRTSIQKESPPSERAAWSNLQRAIRTNNYLALRHALLQWGKALWPNQDIHRLEQVTSRNSRLHNAMGILDEHMYGQQSTIALNLDSLDEVLRVIRKAERKKNRAKHRLTDLYSGT